MYEQYDGLDRGQEELGAVRATACAQARKASKGCTAVAQGATWLVDSPANRDETPLHVAGARCIMSRLVHKQPPQECGRVSQSSR